MKNQMDQRVVAPVVRRIFVFGIAGFCLPAIGLAQSLRESVDASLRRSPTVQRAIQEARMTATDVGAAKAAQLPTLSVEASTGPAYRERTVDGINAGTGDWLLSRRAGFSLQQLLFDYGASGRLVSSARLREAYGNLLIAETLETQALIVVNAYLDVVRFRLQARLMEEKTGALGTYRTTAASRAAKEGDVDSVIVEGRLASSRADWAQAASRARAAERRFEQLTRLSPDHLDLPRLPDADSESGLSTANPKVRAAMIAVDASKENAEALRRDLYPKLLLQLQGSVGKNVSGVEGPDRDLSALAVFRWEIFDGGRKRAALQKARAETDKNSAIVDEVKLAIQDDVTQAVEGLRGARKRYSALSTSIGELTTGLKKTETLLEKGDKNVRLMSVVSAFTEQSNTRRDLVDAQVDRYKSAFAALAASGRLLDYLGVNFNRSRGEGK